MTSKKTAASKRTPLWRAADYAKSFPKDWELLSRTGRYDMNRLKEALGGEWEGHRECHIGGDFLLAYQLDDSAKLGLIVSVRAGTHADLFE